MIKINKKAESESADCGGRNTPQPSVDYVHLFLLLLRTNSTAEDHTPQYPAYSTHSRHSGDTFIKY